MATISVIMGIYNCAATLPDAINSIIEQTYTDWELILCDDGSTDETLKTAFAYQEKYPEKIIVLQNEKKLGLNATLNKCLKVAKGVYIARMDGDDLCEPNRFQEEISVLEKEPEISIVSTDMLFFDEDGIWGEISHPEYPKKIDFLYGSPFCHAPCMVRKEAYDAVEGYSTGTRLLRVEDYHLWVKMYQAGYQGKNIHKALYSMRDDKNAYYRRKFKYRVNEAYVKYLAVRYLKLPILGYVAIFRPMIVGLLPQFLYKKLHKWNLRGKK